MNSRLKTALLVLLALTTVATGIYAWQLNRALQTPLFAASDTNRAALEKRLADAEHRAHDLQNELDALKTNKVAADTPPPDELPGPPNSGDDRGGRRGPGRGNEAFQAFMNDPKMVQLMANRDKLMLDSRYASLFKSLLQGANLSPQQLDAFKNLLVEKENTTRDIRMSARAEGLNDRGEINKLVKTAQAELDAQIQTALGADGFAQYQQYEKTYPQRNLVNQLSQSLSYTSAPLNDTQSKQLVDILASTAPADTNQRRNFGGGTGGIATVTDTAVSQASGVLTPDQLAALLAIQSQQKAQEAMRAAAKAAQNAAAATPTATTTNTVKTKP